MWLNCGSCSDVIPFFQTLQSCRSVFFQTLWSLCQRLVETWGHSVWRWSLPVKACSPACCCMLRARVPLMIPLVEQQWQVRGNQTLVTHRQVTRWHNFSVSSCPLPTQAYLTSDLEVLEEDYHEYVKVSQSSCLYKFKITCLPLAPILILLYCMLCL